MRILFLTLCFAALAPAQTFDVTQLRVPYRNRHGSLTISDSGIELRTKKADEPWRWEWSDIQFLERVSPTRLDLLTYEDSALRLGRDRRYRFEAATEAFSDELWVRIRTQFGRPVTDRAAPIAEAPVVAIPVKRLRGWFGSEGRLVFLPDRIQYETEAPERAHSWRFAEEIASVWSANPYRLEVHVHDGGGGTTVHRFELKQRLPDELYRNLKLRTYRLENEETRLRMLN